MPDTFTLTIELGNDAMQAPEDVARALRRVAVDVERVEFTPLPVHVRDANGNTVGRWEVT